MRSKAPASSGKQPALMDEWGTQFYGKAKSNGDIWWYEEELSDGTIKRHALLPINPELIKE